MNLTSKERWAGPAPRRSAPGCSASRSARAPRWRRDPTGNCSGATDWKLKLGPRDGRIEVEAEIDSNIAGQNWNVKLKRNGSVVFQGIRTTHGPSGSFEVRRVTTNGAGTDNFVLKATNPNTGEVCRGTASI